MDVSSLGEVRRADLAVPQVQTRVPSGWVSAKYAKCLLYRASFLVSVMVATKDADLTSLEVYAIDPPEFERSHSEVFGKAFPRAAYSCIREDLARSSSAIAAEMACCSDPAMAVHAKHNGAAIHARFI